MPSVEPDLTWSSRFARYPAASPGMRSTSEAPPSRAEGRSVATASAVPLRRTACEPAGKGRSRVDRVVAQYQHHIGVVDVSDQAWVAGSSEADPLVAADRGSRP